MILGKGARVAAMAVWLGMAVFAEPIHAQRVYFGIADQWQDLLHHPDDWSYVRQHADGFYINFVMLNRVVNHTAGLSDASLAETCRLFESHTAFLESDIRTPPNGKQGTGGGGGGDGVSAEQDQRYIQMLHGAGCRIAFTSLNYGWSAARAHNLTQFDLTAAEGKRLNFVQTGPWALNGDIDATSQANHPGLNERLREYIRASDGISTDGPLGYWVTDFGHFQNANLSLVRFAHQYQKRAVIMVAPYGAGQKQAYDAKRDWLSAGQQMVRWHESQHVAPDVWSVFEYATDIAALPEQTDGKPANTMSGLVYWLLHHIHDPDHSLHFDPIRSKDGSTQAVNLTLRNDSSWLDLAPLLRLGGHDVRGAVAKILLDGKDVGTDASGSQGLSLVGPMTMGPGQQHQLTLTVERAGAPIAVAAMLLDEGKPTPSEPGLELSLSPNAGVPDEIHQRVFLAFAPY